MLHPSRDLQRHCLQLVVTRKLSTAQQKVHLGAGAWLCDEAAKVFWLRDMQAAQHRQDTVERMVSQVAKPVGALTRRTTQGARSCQQ